ARSHLATYSRRSIVDRIEDETGGKRLCGSPSIQFGEFYAEGASPGVIPTDTLRTLKQLRLVLAERRAGRGFRLEQIARLVVVAGHLRQIEQLLVGQRRAHRVGVAQRTTHERREAGAVDHREVELTRVVDDVVLDSQSRFRDHR